MRRVLFFMMVSLDGFFEGLEHDISWHNADEEFNDFAIAQLEDVDTLLFGRLTYEMMAGYWPTPQARTDDPVVAGKMNSLGKLVFSHSMSEPQWENTRLVRDDFAAEVAGLKAQPGKDLFLFGSADLASTLIRDGLIDEFRVMLNPVLLGAGTPLFQGIGAPLELKLLRSRPFRNGNVLLYYETVKQ